MFLYLARIHLYMYIYNNYSNVGARFDRKMFIRNIHVPNAGGTFSLAFLTVYHGLKYCGSIIV